MPKKILLADDSITIQKVVELTFSDGDYEVTAVNNGAKAVQKLAEMRPDIILSDIIMPEKNGYEVCEYVKSHPDFRNIPVVLLTGTFEPFDPDRAEKAGCDAVVTKPFESQSLIHKVEELIAQAQSSQNAASAPEPVVEEPASPWMEETPDASETNHSFSTASGGFPAAPVAEPFTHDADIFSAAPPEATTEMPFEIPQSAPAFGVDTPFGEEVSGGEAFGGETRAFPRMSFEEMQQMASATSTPEAMPVPEPSPWDEPAPQPIAEAEAEAPFGAPPPAEEFSSETRAFPRMSLEELQQMAAPEPMAEEAGALDAPAFGGETRAFPKLSFDDFQQSPAAEAPAEPSVESSWEPPAFSPAPEPDDSPFASEPASPFAEAEAPAFGGETRAFPKLNFDDFQQMTATPEAEPEPEPQAEPEPALSAWNETASPFSSEPEPAAAEPFEEVSPESEIPAGFTDQPMPEDLPFAVQEQEAEPVAAAEEPSWPLAAGAAEAAEAEAEPEEPAAAAVPSVLAPAAPPMPIAARTSEPADLTDEQVDRIARRVVELLSDQVVRNIAWEVIPDLAEMVVKERIRQLEAEA
jgi:CheY-like chemotaxis protein